MTKDQETPNTQEPLAEMYRKIKDRPEGSKGYLAQNEEIVRLLGSLSKHVSASVVQERSDHPDNLSVKITIGFTLSRPELEKLLAESE